MANFTGMTGRTYVPAPATTPVEGGIFSVATPIELSDADRKQLMGIAYESEACFPAKFVGVDPNSCFSTEEKSFEQFSFVEGYPFHIYAGVNCNLAGQPSASFADIAKARLASGEQRAVEQHLWQSTFPRNAVDLTPSSGAVKPLIGLGLLEEYAGTMYSGVPIVHFGRRAGVFLAGASVLKFDKEDAAVVGGAIPVNGAGYTDLDGPDGKTAGADEVWVYISGVLTLRRGPVNVYDALEPQLNDLYTLAERTYVPTVDCMVGAIRITLE